MIMLMLYCTCKERLLSFTSRHRHDLHILYVLFAVSSLVLVAEEIAYIISFPKSSTRRSRRPVSNQSITAKHQRITQPARHFSNASTTKNSKETEQRKGRRRLESFQQARAKRQRIARCETRMKPLLPASRADTAAIPGTPGHPDGLIGWHGSFVPVVPYLCHGGEARQGLRG